MADALMLTDVTEPVAPLASIGCRRMYLATTPGDKAFIWMPWESMLPSNI